MIRSMTGFASASRENALASVGVTIRTVNHKYLDLQVRLPHALGAIEGRVRARVQAYLTRGRVELAVSTEMRQPGAVEVQLNEAFAEALGAAIETARARGLVAGALAPGDLLRLPQALVVREKALEADSESLAHLTELVDATVDEALAALERMRVTEGQHVSSDLETRRQSLETLVDRLARAAEEGRAAVEARLTERVKAFAAEVPVEPAALAQEIVRAAQRSDVSEELSRLRGHIAHWTMLAEGDEPCGRKLDFLLQEMHREINTMGAKVDGVTASESIIAAKAELEKMREQVQNVE
jgi:uncharacterized protein (TIGR00255 family)